MMTTVKLQNIQLPQDRYAEQYNLYYAGNQMKVNKDGTLELERGNCFDCSSYFNSFSLNKWKKYTNVQKIFLNIKIKGEFTIYLLGHSIEYASDIEENQVDSIDHKKNILIKREYNFEEMSEVALEYPETEDMLLSFEIIAHSKCVFYSGFYKGMIEESDIREVCLSLATTTFKKEEFIIPNIELLRKSILECDEEIAENFYIHVVDNGRSLEKSRFQHSHIQVHPNNNVGGSGGFTRGMIETLKQEKKATHILLMDDDVLIQPESIKKMYMLLKTLKEEYKEHFVSGAMLYYEKMNVQHEDVGYVAEDGTYGPVKQRLNLNQIINCCRNEESWDEKEYQYAGWWYCCIPMTVVREDNLPLPLFVRGDDVEYSLRNHAKFITMNGICVWHMGFSRKFNAMMELYQVHRNSLAIQAMSGVCGKIDFARRIQKFVRVELLRFNYNSAELLLDSIDDYMKGPDFFEKPNGEAIVKQKAEKNEKLIPLSEFQNIKVNMKELYKDVLLSEKDLWLYRLSYNGLYLPEKMLKDETAVIAYDWFYARGKQCLRKQLLAVNPHTGEGAIRKLDKKRARSLKKRASKTFKKYQKNEKILVKQYLDKEKYFKTLEFWKKYLEID